MPSSVICRNAPNKDRTGDLMIDEAFVAVTDHFHPKDVLEFAQVRHAVLLFEFGDQRLDVPVVGDDQVVDYQGNDDQFVVTATNEETRVADALLESEGTQETAKFTIEETR